MKLYCKSCSKITPHLVGENIKCKSCHKLTEARNYHSAYVDFMLEIEAAERKIKLMKATRNFYYALAMTERLDEEGRIIQDQDNGRPVKVKSNPKGWDSTATPNMDEHDPD